LAAESLEGKPVEPRSTVRNGCGALSPQQNSVTRPDLPESLDETLVSYAVNALDMVLK
jgi:hypothetical protein